MTALSYICFAIAALCSALGVALAICFVTKQRLTLRLCLITAPFIVAVAVAKAFLHVPNAIVSMGMPVSMAVIIAISCRSGFRRTLLWTVESFLIVCAQELLATLVYLIVPAETRPLLQDLTHPDVYLLFNLSFTPFVMLVCGAIMLARRLLRRKQTQVGQRQQRLFGVYFRMVMLLVTALVNLYTITKYLVASDFWDHMDEYFGVLLACVLLIVITRVYFVRDLAYLSQLKRNQTLEYQQRMSDALLKKLRYFRHNLVNMLYGFEGTMLSGDVETVRAYYQQMVRRCTMINNENVLAIQRVQSPALGAMLLNKVDAAQQKGVPIYVYVAEAFEPSRAFSESELAEALGALLDNATEAVALADAPYISLSMQNDGRNADIVVKNSFAGELPQGPFTPSASGKEGHEGIGLASCMALVEKRPDALLNTTVDGQYFMAQLYC